MSEKHVMTPETELEELLMQDSAAKITLGLIANHPDSDETRFPLTPEACGILTSAGYRILLESGAAIDISFYDRDYVEYGVEIVDRATALRAGIVLSFQPPLVDDLLKMRKGATLLCMMDGDFFNKEYIETLLRRHITVGCLNNMISHNEEPVFANVIDEIDGRAAIVFAQDSLSFLGQGKGVLLAGVAGINPCEVLLIGAGNRIMSAAFAASSAGASVTIMDNDVSSLQMHRDYCGDRVTTLQIHPKVLYNKVKTADVIIFDQCTRTFTMPEQLSAVMKENVYMLDFREMSPSQTVPRTVAMAVSNVLVNFFDEIQLKGGVNAAIATTPGIQDGIVTIHGKLVDKLIGTFLGMPSVDIAMLLSATN